VYSWTPNENSVGQFLLSETKPHIWTAAAGILGKTNAAVWQEVCGLDPADCAFHQIPELLTLFLGDGRA